MGWSMIWMCTISWLVKDFNMGAIQHGRHGDCGVHERCTCGCCLCSSVSGSISPRGRSEE